MSLQSLAKTLQDQGRGNDSVLVHMTPKEVHGLQSLALAHGGSLTINPTTGLAEAGLLSDILPSVVGIGAGLMGLGPLGVGLASGLTSYATTGDPSRALMSGALSGGLSGLMGGMADVGGNVLGSEISAGAQTAADAAKNQILNTVTPEMSIAGEEATRFAAEQAAEEAGNAFGKMPSYGDKITAGAKNVFSSPQKAWNFIKANPYATAATGLGLAGMMAPGQTAAPGPEAKTGYAPRYTWNPQTRKYETAPAMPYTYYAGGGEIPGTYPQAHIQDKTDFYAQSTATPMSTPVVTDYDARINTQGNVMRAATGAYIPKSKTVNTDVYKEVFDPASAKEDADLMALIAKLSRNPDATRYAAQGDTIKMADGGLPGFLGMLQQITPEFLGIQGQGQGAVKYNYDPNEQRYSRMAQGGIASLNEYAAGGKLLQGPGDGMSDSIPAVIKGAKPQRAALAQGEFVVPADVVSHLGNGSTDAGAKRLYAMMDKVRMARTGNKKQGRQITPEKFMPA